MTDDEKALPALERAWRSRTETEYQEALADYLVDVLKDVDVSRRARALSEAMELVPMPYLHASLSTRGAGAVHLTTVYPGDVRWRRS